MQRPHRQPTAEELAAYNDTLLLLGELVRSLPPPRFASRSFVVVTIRG